MLPYGLLLLFIAGTGLLICEKDPGRSKDAFFLCLTSAVLIVFSAMRAETVGIDYGVYRDYFKQVREGGWEFLISPANRYRMEFGFSLLNDLVSLFTGDARVFMAVSAALMVGMAAVVLYRDCAIPWMGMFVFVSFNFFGNTLSFIRQSLAIGIFLFAIRFLQKRKPLPYVLLVLLAASFHKSMLFLLPVYFLVQIPLNWKTVSVYATAALLVMFFSWPLFSFITQFVYKGYASEKGLYFMNGRSWQTALIPVLLMVSALLLKKMLLERSPENTVLLHFALYAGLLFILTCKHFLFQRIANVFFTSAVFLIPEIVRSIRAETPGKIKSNPKAIPNKIERRKRQQAYRIERSRFLSREAYYRYAVGAVLCFGTLYYIWFLLQNRINLIPYLTL